jgi:hypothetical protein
VIGGAFVDVIVTSIVFAPPDSRMLEDLDERMDSTDAQLNSVVKKVEKILDNISGVCAPPGKWDSVSVQGITDS